MTEQPALKRLIVLVDGPKYLSEIAHGHTNARNIARLRSIIRTGTFYDSPAGRTVTQIVSYHEAIEEDAGLLDKLKSSKDKVKDQVETITTEIFHKLDGPQDELFLYGFSRGANIVRAVAGMLHHIGMPKRQFLHRSSDLFQRGLELSKARRDDDDIKGERLLQGIQEHCDVPPHIRFVGLFDGVKGSMDKTYDTSYNGSIQNIRHALALNEIRATLVPDIIAVPAAVDMSQKSLILAWFVGTHQDIGGGVNHDGLSLYPLQWMILESVRAGLSIQATNPGEGDALTLAFPQFAGEVPQIGVSERIEWHLQYSNGLEVSMFDLYTSHGATQSQEDSSHSVRLQEENVFYSIPRKVFNYHGIVGWSDTGW